ncbi:TolC family outer membrane protein [Actibacterium sp. D379-3]
MKKVIRGAMAGLLSAVFLSGGGAAPARAETLTDALILAYQNSDLLEQNRALLRATDENVAQSIAALRPVISFIANGSYTDTSVTSDTTEAYMTLNASLSIYDGGANRLAVESAKETVLSTRASLLNIEQSVLLSAVQAYMDVSSAIQNVALGNNNVRLITEQLRAAQDRFEVGEVTRTDVSQAQSRLAAAQSSLVAAQGALAVARESYKLVIGRYPGTLTGTPRTPALPKTLEEASAIAQRNHPSLEVAQRQVTVSELTLARARAARKPSITAGANLSHNDNSLESSSIDLTLTQPIYAGGGLVSAERQALANRDAALSNLHYAVRQIEQGVGNAWAQLAVSRAQLRASDQQIRAAQLAFDGTKEEARLGARTTLEVLDAEQELLDARTGRVEAEATQYVAYYQVLSSMGFLTVEHLNLGIPTYDPAAYYNAVKNAPVRSVQGDRLEKVLKSIGQE